MDLLGALLLAKYSLSFFKELLFNNLEIDVHVVYKNWLHKRLIYVTRQHYERKVIKPEFIWTHFYNPLQAIFDVKNFLLKWILCLIFPRSSCEVHYVHVQISSSENSSSKNFEQTSLQTIPPKAMSVSGMSIDYVT